MIIDTKVLDVLKKSTTDGNKLFLPPGQLERNLYVAVNKCLELIGGKWNKSAKAHLFDADPSDLLDEMINTGEVVDKKKELQFFPTPEHIISKMLVLLARLRPDINQVEEHLVWLEPSFGDGAILKYFPVYARKIAFEIDPGLIEKAREKISMFQNGVITQGDFLNKSVEADVVMMNPPFSKQQDIKHIMHAWNCLKKDGCLVSVVSESPFFRETKDAVAFRQWLKDNDAIVIDLERGAFKESGTMVKTRIIGVKKTSEETTIAK